MVARPSNFYDPPEENNKKQAEENSSSQVLKQNSLVNQTAASSPTIVKKGVPLKRAIASQMHQKFVNERKDRFESGAFFWLESTKRRQAEKIWGQIRTVGYVSKRALQKKMRQWPLISLAACALPAVAFSVNYMLKNPDEGRTKIAASNFIGLDRYIDRPKDISVKTCNAIKYLNKIDWKTHQRINYFPGSTFIVCHPDFRLSKARFYAGTFQSTLPNTIENYVILNQKYHLIFPTPLLHQFGEGLDRLSDWPYEKTKKFSRTQLSKLRYWQQPFCELDSLPIRIQHCFNQDLTSYQPKTQARRANPLFDLVHQKSKKEIPLRKRKFLRKFFPRIVVNHEAFLEPHVERLSEALINSNPGSHIRFAGNHRRIQYKIANTFSSLKDILSCHVHTLSFLPADLEDFDEEEGVEINVYATKELSLPHKLNYYTEKPTMMPSLNEIDFKLRDSFQSDVQHFSAQHVDLYLLSNAYNRPTTGLYDVHKPIKQNPFNLVYKNQRHLSFERKNDYPIMPEFQETLLDYLHKELNDAGLPTKRTTALNFHLKPAISKPYRYKIQAARLRKYGPRLSKKGFKYIKTRTIKGESCLLKRKVSGYLFPDTPSKDIWLKSLHWKNRFFVKGSETEDDIFIKLVGTPDLNSWIYKQLIKSQSLTNNGFNNILFSRPKVPFAKERANFNGLVTQDMGVEVVDQSKVEPRNYRYPSKNWMFWIDMPSDNLAKRDYDFDFDKPMVTEEEDSMHPDAPHEEDTFYFASNQRALPLPREPEQPINSVQYPYPPKFEKVNDQFDTYQTMYNPAHKHYSEFGQMKDKNPITIFNYENRFSAKLHAKWSLKDPVFYAYMALIAYLAVRARKITHNYINSFWENLEGFLKHLEVRNLLRFQSLEQFVVYPSDLTLAQMVGGKDHMALFFPFIKFMRRQRFNWTEVPVPVLPDFPRPSWEYVFNEQSFLNDCEALTQNPKHPTLKPDSFPVLYSREMVPKGILLVGSPGTGKTYFVRALAGACNCPIVRYKEQPRSSNRHTAEENDQYQKTTVVKRVFKTAKFRSPSIVFIDELDSLGAKRSDVLGTNDIKSKPRKIYYTKNALVTANAFTEWQKLSLLDLTLDFNKTSLDYQSTFHPRITQALFTPTTDFLTYKPRRAYSTPKTKAEFKPNSDQRKVESVTILLCLLDGLEKRENVIFMGATNRPAVLDSALTRPGRLEKVIYLDLPNQQKRFELLQMYSQRVENNNIDWEFFSGFNQTGGLSPAHIKASMNLATLSLIKKSFDIRSSKPLFGKRQVGSQTNLTIQHGIESVKYRDMYLKSLVRKTIKKLNHAPYSPQMNAFLDSPSKSFHFTQNVELQKTPNHTYLLGSIKGINVPTAHEPEKIIRGCRPKPTEPLTQAQRVARKIYAKHNKKLRLMYLLTQRQDLYLKNYIHYNGTSVLPPKLGMERLDQLYLGRPKKRRALHAFKRYMDQVIRKPTLIAALLLQETPYSMGNPLMFEPRDIFATIGGKKIKSNFKWAAFPKLNIAYYNVITNKNNELLANPPQKTIEKCQQEIFGDALTLKRAAYYTAAKALIISLLDDNLCDSITLSLWSNIKTLHEHRSSQQTFLQLIAKQLITRKQFEQYLLSLIAGKVGEHFFLINEQIDNQSDLGLAEIQQMGWLANIMVEKNLFYSAAPSRALQTTITSVPTPFNDTRQGLGKSKPNQFSRKQRQYDQTPDWSILGCWWQPKLAYERDNFCLKNGIWTKFAQHGSTVFTRKQPEIEFAHPWNEVHAPFDVEAYKTIRPRTDLKQRMLNQSINQDLFEELLESADINWSSIAVLKSQPIFAQLILESFSKAFNILQTNRPLLDYFVHRLYRQEQITGVEAKRITDDFLQEMTDPAVLEEIKTQQQNLNEETQQQTKSSETDQIIEESYLDNQGIQNQDLQDRF